MSFRSSLLRASALKPVAALTLSVGLCLGAAAMLLGSAAMLPGTAWAETAPAETQVSLDDQTGVAITIYNQDLALVRDQRKIPLTAGLNDLAFIDVSAQMRPETALLRVDGAKVTVREQNFNFDLLTPEKLLEKSVGRKVRVITTNYATGAETTEEAVVLSVASGVVLKIGDRIETASPGRIVFDEVPPNLRARPTLVIDTNSDSAASATAQLSYLTGGLSWQADYVAQLSPDEKTLDIDGWVTLTNQSGTSYRDAKLQLVAGDVHRVQQVMMKAMDQATAMPAAAPEQEMTEQALFEYHLYTLGRPTTIAENQTKQVALLSAVSVPVEKEFRFSNLTASGYSSDMGERERVNATVYVSFVNDDASHLGLPLPKGTVRVYKADNDGQVQFVGEDAIDHTPKNEDVRLTLGQAFDVTARAKETRYEKISDTVYESAYEVELKNAKKEPVTVVLVEDVPGEWKILSESAKHEEVNAHRLRWEVQVPAEGSAKFSYAVRIRY
jgi:hypothetical protein